MELAGPLLQPSTHSQIPGRPAAPDAPALSRRRLRRQADAHTLREVRSYKAALGSLSARVRHASQVPRLTRRASMVQRQMLAAREGPELAVTLQLDSCHLLRESSDGDSSAETLEKKMRDFMHARVQRGATMNAGVLSRRRCSACWATHARSPRSSRQPAALTKRRSAHAAGAPAIPARAACRAPARPSRQRRRRRMRACRRATQLWRPSVRAGSRASAAPSSTTARMQRSGARRRAGGGRGGARPCAHGDVSEMARRRWPPAARCWSRTSCRRARPSLRLQRCNNRHVTERSRIYAGFSRNLVVLWESVYRTSALQWGRGRN